MNNVIDVLQDSPLQNKELLLAGSTVQFQALKRKQIKTTPVKTLGSPFTKWEFPFLGHKRYGGGDIMHVPTSW